jgi:outer membrane receptor protein involved in Fe transport
VDSVTGAFDYRPQSRLAIRTTASYGDSTVRRFAPTGLGENSVLGRDHSIESLVDWSPGGSLSLTGGIHVLGTSLDQTTDLSAALLGRGSFTDRQRSVGVFGETNMSLSPRLTFTAGLRYQHDQQERQGALAGASSPINLDFDRGFDAWLPKASLAYGLTNKLTIGLTVQRAYNPGGVSINLTRRAAIEFDAETLWDYEAFARATLAGGALRVSANAFYYDMFDSQRALLREFVLPGGQSARFQEISNAPRARSQGLEAQAQWRTSRRLTIGAAIGVSDTRITATPTSTDPTLRKQFQRSPRFSASASIDWKPVEALRLATQLRHNSGYFSDDAETAALQVGGSTTVDAKASWQTGRVTLFAYVRNAFDEFYLTYLFSSGRLATAGDPREFGLGLEARF